MEELKALPNPFRPTLGGEEPDWRESEGNGGGEWFGWAELLKGKKDQVYREMRGET